jgi:hypothetical protein
VAGPVGAGTRLASAGHAGDRAGHAGGPVRVYSSGATKRIEVAGGPSARHAESDSDV